MRSEGCQDPALGSGSCHLPAPGGDSEAGRGARAGSRCALTGGGGWVGALTPHPLRAAGRIVSPGGSRDRNEAVDTDLVLAMGADPARLVVWPLGPFARNGDGLPAGPPWASWAGHCRQRLGLRGVCCGLRVGVLFLYALFGHRPSICMFISSRHSRKIPYGFM